MVKKDYYSILNITKDATKDDIKKAYRKLAKECHPDLHPDDEDKETQFKLIAEAYDVLSDDTKRQEYDNPTTHRTYFDDLYGNGPNPFNDGTWGNMFNQMYGKGRDKRLRLSITLEEAYNGVKKILNVDNEKLEVVLPAGIETNNIMTFKGKGHNGIESRGDLIIIIHVIEHDKFIREANNLRYYHTIDMFTAIDGGTIEVPTLTGNVKMNINKGVQPGALYRLRGKGMPVVNYPDLIGDLYVTINVEIPVNISDRAKELLSELKEEITNKEK